jgi:hypothetical protein
MNEQDYLDPVWYIETFLWVRNKKKQIVPFKLNVVQRHYMARRTNRDLVLKGRQHGFSTLKLAEYLHDTITNVGTHTKIVAHKRDAAGKLLAALKLMFSRIPPQDRPRVQYDNKYEFTFPDLNSSITIAPATKDAGRSETINNLLATEVAFWADAEETLSGLLEAVPEEGNICIESTPNGVGDKFYNMVQDARAGMSEWRLHEYPWWMNPEYRVRLEPGEKLEYTEEEIRLIGAYNLTPEQIKWRRRKIQRLGKRKFAREYECNFLQSGRPVFDAEAIDSWSKKAPIYEDNYLRVWEWPKPGERYAMGVDTCEGLEDGDLACIKVFKMSTWEEVASLHGPLAPTVLAARVDKLARLYRQGERYGVIVGVERNNHGHAVLVKLVEWQTPGLYYFRPQRAGWDTNPATKPVMIDELEEAVRNGLITIYDEATKGEMRAYEWKDDGSAGAPEGSHDDTVLATMVAWQMRKATPWNIWEPSDEDEDGAQVTIIG